MHVAAQTFDKIYREIDELSCCLTSPQGMSKKCLEKHNISML